MISSTRHPMMMKHESNRYVARLILKWATQRRGLRQRLRRVMYPNARRSNPRYLSLSPSTDHPWPKVLAKM